MPPPRPAGRRQAEERRATAEGAGSDAAGRVSGTEIPHFVFPTVTHRRRYIGGRVPRSGTGFSASSTRRAGAAASQHPGILRRDMLLPCALVAALLAASHAGECHPPSRLTSWRKQVARSLARRAVGALSSLLFSSPLLACGMDIFSDFFFFS